MHVAHILLQAFSGAIVTLPLSRLLPFVNRGGVLRRVLSLLFVVGIAAFLWNIFRMATFDAMIKASDIWRDFGGWYFTAFLIFGLWVALYYSVQAYVAVAAERQHVEMERIRRVEAENLSRQSQMMMLRYQVNPHFLFNTLNSVSALIKTSRPEQARDMVTQLSTFMRYTLERDYMIATSFEEELRLINIYLNIERVRYGERLKTEFHIDDEALSASVPSMILQPLFENTMKYVIAGTIDGGIIRLSARQQNGKLHIIMEDSGHPDHQNVDEVLSNLKKGVGLKNMEDRLRVHYQNESDMILGGSDLGGLKIDLIMPLRRQSDSVKVT
ncbi:MAG: histidine kinase [Maricaulaceae bacterium]